MKFLSFEFIPLMLVPSLILLYLVLTNKSMIERIFESELLQKLKIDQGLPKKMRMSLLFGALFLMIVALARPVYQKGVVEVASLRANLVIALDISRSMKAKDLYPNRLEFAKKKIEELIDKTNNLSIGILAFAKDAYIVSPITDDKASLTYLLHRLHTNELSLRGTNILSALMSAKLLYGNKRPRNILIVTDGGDKKDFKDEIAYAKENGFKVFILGVATKRGAPIEENGGYLKDKKGNIVITKLNTDIAKLAKATGGEFVQARLDSSDIGLILKKIGGLQKEKKTEKIVDQTELYPYVLALSLLLLFLSFFDIPHKNIAFLLLLGTYLHAGMMDFQIIKQAKESYMKGHYEKAAKEFAKIASQKETPQSYYDLGNALYKAKKYKAAIKAYNKVQTQDRELEFRKLHNLGNSYFQLKNYKKAIEMYEKALHLKQDKDTKFNLELAKKMLKKQQQKKQNKKQQKQQKQKNKKKQQKGKQNKKNQKQNATKQKKEQKQKSGKKQSAKKGKEQKNEPISKREEKKWLKLIQKNSAPTLLYKAPIKPKKEEETNENPW